MIDHQECRLFDLNPGNFQRVRLVKILLQAGNLPAGPLPASQFLDDSLPPLGLGSQFRDLRPQALNIIFRKGSSNVLRWACAIGDGVICGSRRADYVVNHPRGGPEQHGRGQ